ncbi:Fasciclin-like arabinogalactan protein 1 [Forsythia ovata]|uniref:Fasciclin-like arabinogalactan protein 1 n=1 Tax=Forsythia ovata TaxID=205694 RepID=A0ABD1SQ66_9LAMI
MLLANPAQKTFEDAVDGGLTIFCLGDYAMKNFLSKYKNLTAAPKKSFLEFHGMPIYQSLSSLKSNNGLTNTLAIDGAIKYNFVVQNDGNEVPVKTKLVTTKIVDTIIVNEQPLAIFSLNKVLMSGELFKLAPTPAPTPTADSLGPSKKKHKSLHAPATPSDFPTDSPDCEQ